jgi:hypothetical protein
MSITRVMEMPSLVGTCDGPASLHEPLLPHRSDGRQTCAPSRERVRTASENAVSPTKSGAVACSDPVVGVRLWIGGRCTSGDRRFSGDMAENSLQPGTDLACDRRERGVSYHAKHLLGRDGTHVGLSVIDKHRDVARQ